MDDPIYVPEISSDESNFPLNAFLQFKKKINKNKRTNDNIFQDKICNNADISSLALTDSYFSSNSPDYTLEDKRNKLEHNDLKNSSPSTKKNSPLKRDAIHDSPIIS